MQRQRMVIVIEGELSEADFDVLREVIQDMATSPVTVELEEFGTIVEEVLTCDDADGGAG